MKTLLQMAELLAGLLKEQPYGEDTSYRLMHFVIQQPVDDGLLLYNMVTKSLVFLDAEEARKMADNPASIPELVSHWFAVPLDHDDRRLALEVRAVGKMLQNPVKGIKSFTILTTTDCNARCFYCYEKGRSRIPMSDNTARQVAEYIIKNAAEGTIRLRWFGGEPLYNKKAITQICSRLSAEGIPFRSSMVSNGFLFDDGTVAEAVQSWKLKKIQITLDGTEKVYNRTKAYIDPGENPFRQVLVNIQRLVAAGVRVNIRLNIDRHNSDDLFSLTEMLGEAYGNNPLVKVYSHSLFEVCDAKAAVKHSDSQRKELFEKQTRLRNRFQELGLFRPGKPSTILKLNHCMADSDDSVLILPDGHIGKCEHFSDSEWFGHISEETRDESVLKSFKALRQELDICPQCPLYPNCFRLSKCEETVHCYPEEREEKLIAIRQQMKSFYSSHEVQN